MGCEREGTVRRADVTRADLALCKQVRAHPSVRGQRKKSRGARSSVISHRQPRSGLTAWIWKSL